VGGTQAAEPRSRVGQVDEIAGGGCEFIEKRP
jgi:hypothetical protein